MSVKEYSDLEIGTVKLVKSPVSRRVSIRVHPADGIKVIIPRSLSYDEGLRFFMLKRDWVITVIAKQKKKISAAEEEGKTVALLRDGAVVNTLLSEIVFRRGEEGRGKAATVTAETVQVEDVKMTGRTFLSPDRPVVRKTLTYTGKLPPEGSHELDIFLRQVLVEVLRTEAKLILQVHDELIVECPEGETDRVKTLLETEMEQVVELALPLVAEAHAGKSWAQAKG